MAMINWSCPNCIIMEEKKLNLFGTQYLIKFVDEIKREEDGKTSITEGLCDSANRIISVALKQPDGNPTPAYDLRKNLLHECFHAILDEGQYLNNSDDEPLVEWLARCMTSILDQGVLDDWKSLGQSKSLQDPQLEIPFGGQEGEINRKSVNA